jgi:CRP/FNR family transcriptional regulator, cyclic AMP receptor protein
VSVLTTVTAPALAGHQFLRGMPEGQLEYLARHAVLLSVPAKHRFFEVGGTAQGFLLIRAGQVALDMVAPGQGRMVVEAIGRGEVVGVSWFFPPFRWEFGAVALQPTEVFELDAAAVRRHCEDDPDFGYEFTRRLISVVARRLQGTRRRMIQLCADQGRVG